MRSFARQYLAHRPAPSSSLTWAALVPMSGWGHRLDYRPAFFQRSTKRAARRRAGDQLTDIEYTGFLNFIPDVNTNTASFSLNGLNAVGPANVFGSLVVQNYTGGVFSLYDPADNLLLQGPMANTTLSGVLGSSGNRRPIYGHAGHGDGRVVVAAHRAGLGVAVDELDQREWRERLWSRGWWTAAEFVFGGCEYQHCS